MSIEIKDPWNPSKKATARVKDKLPLPTTCHYCNAVICIKHHRDIYNGQVYGEWPWAYVCTGCGASVGMHPFTNIPLGTVANYELRLARNKAKKIFNEQWMNTRLSRNDAYSLLADRLGIQKSKCHIGWSDIETCQRIIMVCKGGLV